MSSAEASRNGSPSTKVRAITSENGKSREHRFRAIYDALFADLTGYCRRRVPPADVGDVVAETMTLVWTRLDDVPAGDAARPWTFAVARNLIRNRWRSEHRTGALREVLVNELMAQQDQGRDPSADHLLVREEFEALVDALQSLKPNDREVIRLAAWEGLAHADIAVVIDCSTNAVAIRLHRARTRLTKALERDARWTDPKGFSGSRHVDADGRPKTEDIASVGTANQEGPPQ